MIARLLLGSGGIIYLTLGTLHLLYTFFTPKFKPYDAKVEDAMKTTTPRLTKQTTMWNAWMGFNGSHSTGAMFFGFIMIYFSLADTTLFEESIIIQAVVLLNSLFYLNLARRYWFRIPLIGITVASFCLALSILRIHLS